MALKPSIIYCDLDGVLADFDRAYEEQFGLNLRGKEHTSDQEFWEKITVYRINNGDTEGWFNTLLPTPDYMELWGYLKSLDVPVALLTATGLDRERAVREKIIWIRKHLGHNEVPIFVSSGKDKYKYATKTAILIDDTPKCIIPWRCAGGTGILHTSAEDTIKQLKEVMNGN